MWRSMGKGVLYKTFDVKVQVHFVPELSRQTFWKVNRFVKYSFSYRTSHIIMWLSGQGIYFRSFREFLMNRFYSTHDDWLFKNLKNLGMDFLSLHTYFCFLRNSLQYVSYFSWYYLSTPFFLEGLLLNCSTVCIGFRDWEWFRDWFSQSAWHVLSDSH